MYWYSNGQIRLCDFKHPMGMNLNEDNRWVKRALLIPWNDIEKRYASLFTNRKGNVAKPLRLVLGACIIQADYGFPDEEIALQIQTSVFIANNSTIIQQHYPPIYENSVDTHEIQHRQSQYTHFYTV